MMAAGLQPEQLAIEHVRNRRQWVPVARVCVRERPGNVPEVNSAGDDGVFIDVNVIVEINEIVSERLTEQGPGDRDEQDACDQR